MKLKIIPWGQFYSAVVIDTGEKIIYVKDVLFILYTNEAKKVVELLSQ